MLRVFHRRGEQRGKEARAQQRMAKKLPRVRPTARAQRESEEPTVPAMTVFVVVEGIEKPRGGVGNQIKQDRAQQSAADQRKDVGPWFESAAEEKNRRVGGVVHQLIDLKTVPPSRTKIEKVQRHVGENHDAKRHPPT